MSETKKKHKQTSKLWLVFPSIVALALVMFELMRGKNIALFNPKGYIALQQHRLILFSTALLLLIAIPSVFLLFYTAWKYRETNGQAAYEPDARHGKYLITSIWLVPTTVMIIFSVILLSATFRLVPQKQIESSTKPLIIQVISLRWKWVFIYPEQNIATVNYVQLPVHQPIRFDLTADDAPMSSFWIPNIGGQLYSMTGMVNRLNLMADTPGDYPGGSAEINGAGFAGMQFIAHASPGNGFSDWVQSVKQSNNNVLDDATYAALLKPSENNPPVLYSSTDSGLYDKVLMKYMDPSQDHMQMVGSMEHEHI